MLDRCCNSDPSLASGRGAGPVVRASSAEPFPRGGDGRQRGRIGGPSHGDSMLEVGCDSCAVGRIVAPPSVWDHYYPHIDRPQTMAPCNHEVSMKVLMVHDAINHQ